MLVRETITYKTPGEVASDYFYNRSVRKKCKLCSLSYAYRNGRDLHYALNDSIIDIKYSPIVFNAEFNFL